MALNPDDTLSSGHYRIIRQLRRGGFRFVYLAEDTLLAEEVAIKALTPAHVGDEAMLSGVWSEARLSRPCRKAEGRGFGQRHVHQQSNRYGVDAFSAVVHPPRAAILTVGLVTGRAIPIDGRPVGRPTTIVGRSFDHRVFEGARAAQLLDTLVG